MKRTASFLREGGGKLLAARRCLDIARERETHKELGFKTWGEYVEAVCPFSRATVHRILQEARVAVLIDDTPSNEPEPKARLSQDETNTSSNNSSQDDAPPKPPTRTRSNPAAGDAVAKALEAVPTELRDEVLKRAKKKAGGSLTAKAIKEAAAEVAEERKAPVQVTDEVGNVITDEELRVVMTHISARLAAVAPTVFVSVCSQAYPMEHGARRRMGSGGKDC